MKPAQLASPFISNLIDGIYMVAGGSLGTGGMRQSRTRQSALQFHPNVACASFIDRVRVPVKESDTSKSNHVVCKVKATEQLSMEGQESFRTFR